MKVSEKIRYSPFAIRLIAAAALAADLIGAAPASAQPFPSRTMSLAVGYAPGGTGDFVARLLAVRLAAIFGQSVAVENRAGASGAIPAQSVASAAPDGHTLLGGHTPEHAVNPHWRTRLGLRVDNEMPTVSEVTGIKDFDFTVWFGMFAPRQTPKAVVARLNRAINGILAQPDFKEKMYEAGADAIPMSVDEFTAFMRAESDKYLAVIQETGIKPE